MEREARQARRPTLTALRAASLHAQVGTKERPPGTNKGTAQEKEPIDDVAKTAFARQGLREDETSMEDRSSRRMRTLVTLVARSRPVR
jgi:hypothetical protein